MPSVGTETNQVRAVQAAYSAFARGDIEALLGTLADDVAWDASDALWVKGTFFGHEGVREYMSGIATLWGICVSRTTTSKASVPGRSWFEVGCAAAIAPPGRLQTRRSCTGSTLETRERSRSSASSWTRTGNPEGDTLARPLDWGEQGK